MARLLMLEGDLVCYLSDSAGVVEAVYVDHALPGPRLPLVSPAWASASMG